MSILQVFILLDIGLASEAPVNVGGNYNRPKVLRRDAFVKLGYMLETLVNLGLP